VGPATSRSGRPPAPPRLPAYAQFDNDTRFQGAHQHPEYFAGSRREFTVPLVYPGTPFQVKVWEALRGIPYGETYSYEKLAWSVGIPRAQRAVGHANGQNRLAVLIPCHRVVNKDGKLGGYGGGLWRKQLLLDLERGQLTGLVQGPDQMQSSLFGA